ncbi:uncharacterized protein LOC126263574 [Schistocerca nitens]|uniref:uncharacterized protein LOC126263574 n=1 Tax=Schistocerca nitens TaxID=7011 RepID=UPI0021188E4F|nr:uncharacterized protein LOC126263574 [Schistocerca nitens]
MRGWGRWWWWGVSAGQVLRCAEGLLLRRRRRRYIIAVREAAAEPRAAPETWQRRAGRPATGGGARCHARSTTQSRRRRRPGNTRFSVGLCERVREASCRVARVCEPASAQVPVGRRLRPTRPQPTSLHLAGTRDTSCCGFRSPGSSCAGDIAPMDVLLPCLPGRCTQVSEQRPAEAAE